VTAAPATPAAELSALARTLRERAGDVRKSRALAGFDGFVDEMITVVAERRGVGSYTGMASMRELAGALGDAAGRNMLREIVVRSQDAGGCAVNLGDGLCALGVGLDFWGTIGQPRHPAFDDFAGKCRSNTALGRSYGRTLAFEFGDGKAMFSAVEQLAELTPELLGKAAADGRFAGDCAAAGLIALTNWTLYPHMTDCWKWLQAGPLKALKHRPWLFVDLVDPSGRGRDEVARMLDSLRGFQATCRTVLGVNLTEIEAVSKVLGMTACGTVPSAIAARAAALREKLGIEQVVVHNAKSTAVADAGGEVLVQAPGPHCANPKKTTGAGDRFNAGYCLGLLLELPARQRLALGSATGGFFVRNARSASLDEVAGFLDSWAGGKVAEARGG
jgi:hypothetical protein